LIEGWGGALGTIEQLVKENPALAGRLEIRRVVPKERKLKPDFEEPKKPAVQVSWNEAMGYADWWNEQLRSKHPWMAEEHWRARLPTEAEWE
ncbi:MAG TPA: hypothetical protein DF383_08560, partial [Deltaproteobacteria bacterium]|nr:hypothetical protein [Deltaproteobacteria bacterium]